MNKIGDLKNWNEVTRGLYRYVVAASVCYEIHIMYHAHNTDILTANAQLYIVGEWRDKNQTFFECDLLFIGPVSACLEQAIKEHEEDEYND